jgi:hypothetical protein
MDREDMGMLQTGSQLDLTLEAIGAERQSELGMEHLERDRPIVAEVVGEKHGGHAAAAERALEPVAVAQGISQGGREVGKRRWGGDD